ncbi:MAG TPA: SDR family NAD(P)-dependent oxidoreductase [Planctomycetes bacterium]|nr:SDR family NAD(P)-dependent oxidoreductase [Planctomycetota bacterium]
MQTQEPLTGKTALVTGASSGIGAATSRLLARRGASLVLAARRRDRLEALAAECGGAEVLVLDVRDEPAVRAALADRRFDIVVANAGLGRGMDAIQEGDPEEWAEMIDTNVKGVLAITRHTLPAMLAHGRGDLVLLGSVAGRHVYPGGNVYCATKHAVRAIYEAIRVDAAGKGLRVTTVDPGMVETEFSVVRFRGDAEQAQRVYEGFDPLTPADVADAILYALTRPPHVNIGEIVLWPTAQASTTQVTRTAR